MGKQPSRKVLVRKQLYSGFASVSRNSSDSRSARREARENQVSEEFFDHFCVHRSYRRGTTGSAYMLGVQNV